MEVRKRFLATYSVLIGVGQREDAGSCRDPSAWTWAHGRPEQGCGAVERQGTGAGTGQGLGLGSTPQRGHEQEEPREEPPKWKVRESRREARPKGSEADAGLGSQATEAEPLPREEEAQTINTHYSFKCVVVKGRHQSYDKEQV